MEINIFMDISKYRMEMRYNMVISFEYSKNIISFSRFGTYQIFKSSRAKSDPIL